MDKRIRLIEPNDAIQIILKKDTSENERDCITVIVYGETSDFNYIEFNYDIEFNNDTDRDKTFNEITNELIFEDIKKIAESSSIPILLS